MSDINENVLINFQTSSEQLKTTIDQMAQANALGADSVDIYKAVNSAIQQNTQVTNANTVATSQNVSASSEQQQTYDTLSKSLATLSGSSKKAAQDLLTLSPDEITKGFDELGISVDDYVKILQGASKGTADLTKNQNTLRTQILQNKNALAELTATNQQGTEQFTALALETGKLQNSLTQTNQVVKNLATDAPLVRTFGEAVSGMAGAFQAATGAAALFGDDNKDLQETLIKVTSVTAIAQGVEQALNLVRKEGAISTAAIVLQEKILVAQEIIANGVESESIIIRYAAIVAQKALNLAMAVNPILLVVTALITFVAALYEYTQSTKAATAATAAFNGVLDANGAALDASIAGLQDAAAKQNAYLASQGAVQSTILKNTGSNLKLQQQQIQDAIEAQAKANDELSEKDVKNKADLLKQGGDKLLALQTQLGKIQTEAYVNDLNARKQLLIESLNDQISLVQGNLALASKSGTAQFALQKQLANAQSALAIQNAGEDAAKVLEIQKENLQKLHDITVAQQKFTDADKLAAAEDGLIKIQNESKAINDRISQDEITAQTKVLQAQLKITLDNEALTANERKDAVDKTNQQILELNRNFRKQDLTYTIEDDDSKNKVILSNLQASTKDKLAAQINSIIDEAQLEIVQNQGKNDKIKEIEAKRDNDIKAARAKAIDEEAAYEIAAFQNATAGQDRALEESLANQAKIRNATGGVNAKKVVEQQTGESESTIDTQLTQIDTLTEHQVAALKIQEEAINKKNLDGALSNEEYLKEYNANIDEQDKATEDGEKRKRDLINETADLQKKRAQEVTQISLQAVSDGLGILTNFYAQEDQAADDRLSAQKQRVQDELDAGNISAKEAAARNNALDIQQKKLQVEQAKRNKALALFQAIINTALAVTNAITTGDPYTAALRAAIAGAIGAAEIAVIASKPIPQFDKGKQKGIYEGLGQVAERRPEIIERDGRMYLVKEPTITWLNKSDKVYNPSETADMIEARSFGKNLIVNPSSQVSYGSQNMDYDRLGKTISNSIPQSGNDIDEDGFLRWVKKGNLKTIYRNKRRRWQ